MSANKYISTQHLYMRAGFGENAIILEENAGKSPRKLVKKLLEEAETFTDLVVEKENPMMADEMQDLSKEEKQALRKESKEFIKALNIKWLDKMTESKGMLREKMTLFWHGHFACQSPNVFFVQQQHNQIRKHALGKFGDLLVEVSKSAAMLQFLNNKQNRKDSPNENFAREVLELFTLGRGNYTEADIKNAARAFTGWNFDEEGSFMFRQRTHDTGQKTFMGKTGNFSGDDILKMLLENKQTARYITTKVYRYFVNEKVDEGIVEKLATQFYESEYDIAALMQEIFTADWFYEPANIGTRIKSPIELLVGLRKQLNISFADTESQLIIQKVLGQILFYPPNVAGWKEGKSWIDSSTLLFRLMLPSVLAKAANLDMQLKEDGDVNTAFFAKKKRIEIKANLNFGNFQQVFGNTKTKDLIANLSDYLLQTEILSPNKALLESKIDGSLQENSLKTLVLAFLSLPEFQMG
jgi:uncharacterized protein (DUF1800 family)